MSRLCRLKTKTHGADGQWAYEEITILRQRVQELEELLKESYKDADEVLRPRVAELEKERDEEIARNRPLRNLIASLEEQKLHWNKQRDEYREAVSTMDSERSANATLTAERDALKKELAHWKNNHETEVRRARILKERTDMPIERVQAYEKWGEDQARIANLTAERDSAYKIADHYRDERDELLAALEAGRRLIELISPFEGDVTRQIDKAIASVKEVWEGLVSIAWEADKQPPPGTKLYEHPLPPDDVVRDAERYRWLRDVGCHEFKPFVQSWMKTANECDAAIDAAMKGGAA